MMEVGSGGNNNNNTEGRVYSHKLSQGEGKEQLHLEEGENWLRLVLPCTADVEKNDILLDILQDTQEPSSHGSPYPSVVSLSEVGHIDAPTKDNFLCLDVDGPHLTIKDMRDKRDGQDRENDNGRKHATDSRHQDGTDDEDPSAALEIHIQRRRRPLETMGVAAATAAVTATATATTQATAGTGDQSITDGRRTRKNQDSDNDDENDDGDDDDTNDEETNGEMTEYNGQEDEHYFVSEILPRRQMRLLRPGDRICTKANGEDKMGLVLTCCRIYGIPERTHTQAAVSQIPLTALSARDDDNDAPSDTSTNENMETMLDSSMEETTSSSRPETQDGTAFRAHVASTLVVRGIGRGDTQGKDGEDGDDKEAGIDEDNDPDATQSFSDPPVQVGTQSPRPRPGREIESGSDTEMDEPHDDGKDDDSVKELDNDSTPTMDQRRNETNNVDKDEDDQDEDINDDETTINGDEEETEPMLGGTMLSESTQEQTVVVRQSESPKDDTSIKEGNSQERPQSGRKRLFAYIEEKTSPVRKQSRESKRQQTDQQKNGQSVSVGDETQLGEEDAQTKTKPTQERHSLASQNLTTGGTHSEALLTSGGVGINGNDKPTIPPDRRQRTGLVDEKESPHPGSTPSSGTPRDTDGMDTNNTPIDEDGSNDETAKVNTDEVLPTPHSWVSTTTTPMTDGKIDNKDKDHIVVRASKSDEKPAKSRTRMRLDGSSDSKPSGQSRTTPSESPDRSSGSAALSEIEDAVAPSKINRLPKMLGTQTYSIRQRRSRRARSSVSSSRSRTALFSRNNSDDDGDDDDEDEIDDPEDLSAAKSMLQIGRRPLDVTERRGSEGMLVDGNDNNRNNKKDDVDSDDDDGGGGGDDDDDDDNNDDDCKDDNDGGQLVGTRRRTRRRRLSNNRVVSRLSNTSQQSGTQSLRRRSSRTRSPQSSLVSTQDNDGPTLRVETKPRMTRQQRSPASLTSSSLETETETKDGCAATNAEVRILFTGVEILERHRKV